MAVSRRTTDNENPKSRACGDENSPVTHSLDMKQRDFLSPSYWNGYQQLSFQAIDLPPANFLGIELPLPKKEGKAHFLTKSHIDLSFPDIRSQSQITIESDPKKSIKYVGTALTPSTRQVYQSVYKPPLHSIQGRNDLKINNMPLDSNTAMYQFKVNKKLAKKVNIN